MTFNLMDHKRPDNTFPDLVTKSNEKISGAYYLDTNNSYKIKAMVDTVLMSWTKHGKYDLGMSDCWADIVGLWVEPITVKAKEMELRDQFAIAALNKIMKDSRVKSYEHAAIESYKMADAMMKARAT